MVTDTQGGIMIKWAQLTGIAAVLIAISVIYTQADNGVKCIQKHVVAPVIEQEFNRLHEPYGRALDDVSYNVKVVVEMIKIANENDPHLLNKAIDRVNNTGTFGGR